MIQRLVLATLLAALVPMSVAAQPTSGDNGQPSRLNPDPPPVTEAQQELQGTWTATKAQRDGKTAADVVGHRLSFAGKRFRIQAKDGKPLYEGSFRVNANAKPATIDFEHEEGVLAGKTWKGIYALDGDKLKTCDNAPNLDKGRPRVFEAKAGSGHVLITFMRARP
jgi:uncharacterized protein (TIGR03067 family)